MLKNKFKQFAKKLFGRSLRGISYPASITELFQLEIVFLITPGRSGTKSLVDYCLQHSDFFSIHSPETTLGSINYLFDQQFITEESATWCYYASREKYLMRSFSDKTVFLDGDCKSLSLLPLLAVKFPNSKFIHLVRKPESFIKSGLSRGYFTIKPALFWGYLEQKNQNDFTEIEKIAWFWNKANLIAEEMKVNLPASRVKTLIAEDMFKNGAEIRDAFEQLNLLSHFDGICKKEVLKVNNAQNRKIDIDDEISKKIDKAVIDICCTKKNYYNCKS
jgi:hypothetical protein